jgi:hypothetical protein
VHPRVLLIRAYTLVAHRIVAVNQDGSYTVGRQDSSSFYTDITFYRDHLLTCRFQRTARAVHRRPNHLRPQETLQAARGSSVFVPSPLRLLPRTPGHPRGIWLGSCLRSEHVDFTPDRPSPPSAVCTMFGSVSGCGADAGRMDIRRGHDEAKILHHTALPQVLDAVNEGNNLLARLEPETLRTIARFAQRTLQYNHLITSARRIIDKSTINGTTSLYRGSPSIRRSKTTGLVGCATRRTSMPSGFRTVQRDEKSTEVGVFIKQ